MSAIRDNEPMALDRWRTPALVVAIVGLLLCVFGAMSNAQEFFRSYLVAFVFVTSLSVGSLAILMIQYLTGGVWGILLRRPLEAAVRVMPLAAVAFIPLALALPQLYEWAHSDVVAHDAILRHKAIYLNSGFFIGRTIAYFVLWLGSAYLLDRWSGRQEEMAEAPSPWRGLKIRKLSGFGLVMIGLTLTFAAVDWLMSLTPHWFSTMFGISFMIGNALTAFAFAVIVAVILSGVEPVSRIVVPTNFRDLGNLLFAFIMLWAYAWFGEYLLIWYGNIREETPWYFVRSHGGWGAVSIALIVFHFFLPFFILLMRRVKDRGRTLAIVAALVLFMRVVHGIWVVRPSLGPGFDVSWLDPVAVISLFALWLFFFIGQLRRRPLLPQDEPYVREALGHA